MGFNSLKGLCSTENRPHDKHSYHSRHQCCYSNINNIPVAVLEKRVNYFVEERNYCSSSPQIDAGSD